MTNNLQEILKLIQNGENLTIEFKESKNRPNKDLYETVYAFANRAGGNMFLGIKDEGTVTGIDENHIENIKKNFITTINNLQILGKANGTKKEHITSLKKEGKLKRISITKS